MKIFIQEKPCFIYPRRYPFQVGGEFLHCKTQFLCVSSRGPRLSERDLSVRLVEDHGVARLNSSLLREFLGNRDLKLLRNLVLLQSNTSLLQGNLRVSNCPRLLPNKSPTRGRHGVRSEGVTELEDFIAEIIPQGLKESELNLLISATASISGSSDTSASTFLLRAEATCIESLGSEPYSATRRCASRIISSETGTNRKLGKTENFSPA